MRTILMNRFVLMLFLAVGLLMAGCSSGSKQIVGTWKGDVMAAMQTDTAKDKDSSDVGKAFANGIKSFVGSMIGPITLEFNADGKYKMSMNLGSATGTYTVSGNEVTLVPDKKDDNSNKVNIGKLEISSDGTKLITKKEFNSDSAFEFKKE